MAVMITGGTGLVGLNLAEALLARGEHVVVVALDDVPAPARRVFAGLPGRLTAVVADVSDTDALTTLMRRHHVRGLFPFASLEEIREAVALINADYARQSIGAIEVAYEFFDADSVLRKLVKESDI